MQDEDLTLALELAAVARDVALAHFHAGVSRSLKADGSPVTQGDLAVEAALLERLQRARPHDAVLSEEAGALGQGSRRWILDPIDGTVEFAAGDRAWGTHIALEQDGELLLGVVTRPLADHCYWACLGAGAYRSAIGSASRDERLAVSDTTEPQSARIMLWGRRGGEREAAVRARHHFVEPNHDAVLELLEGKIDALYDCCGKPWDLAPGVILAREAGGRFADFQGGQRLDLRGGWLSNGRLDASLRELSGLAS